MNAESLSIVERFVPARRPLRAADDDPAVSLRPLYRARTLGPTHSRVGGAHAGPPDHDDGPKLVVLAMNGWDEGHPAWWLNLEAHPDATVRLAHQRPRLVHTRTAEGEERDRLWQRWAEIDVGLDAYASGRSATTPMVVLEPCDERPNGTD